MFSRHGICELNPSFENIIKMIFFLLNVGTDMSNEYSINTTGLIKLITDFGFKSENIRIKEEVLIINDIIEFTFNYGHGDVRFVSQGKDDNYIFSYNNTNCILQFSEAFHINSLRLYDKIILGGQGLRIILGDSLSLYNIIENKSLLSIDQFIHTLNDISGDVKSYIEKEIKIKSRRVLFPNVKNIFFWKYFEDKINPGYFDNVEIVNFLHDATFNQPIEAGTFPNLKKIQFGAGFNSEIQVNAMPNVEEILFHYDSLFNHHIVSGTFPQLKKIEFARVFASTIHHGSMPLVEEVIFDNNSRFDHPIVSGTFPKLKKIKFGGRFNSEIHPGSMPLVEEVIFPRYSSFKIPIRKGTFPNLKKIVFDNGFNNEIDPDAMPSTVEVYEYNPSKWGIGNDSDIRRVKIT